MVSPGKRRDSQAVRNYEARPAVEWGSFRDGCILWIRDRASVDRHIPSLTDGFRMDDWVYDHPCVVLRFYKHDVKGEMVKVAPVTAHPQKSPGEYIPIAPLNARNGCQLTLRNKRALEKPSYVKKICFEIDARMLALFSGVSADTFRLTKGSMKLLLAKMPPVIEWAVPEPPSSSSNGNTVLPHGASDHRTNSTPERLNRDVEAQSLLGHPDSQVTGYGSTGFLGKSSYVARTQQIRCIAELVLKLMLCIPMLLVLIACVTARFIGDFMLRGPVTTYDAAGKLLLALWTISLADMVGDY
ncbi:uncharacterized protein PV07_03928 [Cladophialophora immunda]|uniref:Uncharacterized protein n=1 Tax=Cladophialophora immunda TaxID=569365 RepID=A0A0D1ZW24_9EURO|nr:uncharacterized protein PV07_03928 [Cladophialophora immunda]KIW32376.1 hypothetical protein PV07_03928 [Cladophialophora immunda]